MTQVNDARRRLTMKEVALPVVDEVRAQARVLVAESGESPHQLFGPPQEWVTEQIAERRREGLPTAVPDPAASWRDVPVLGMYAAAGISLVVLLHCARQRRVTCCVGLRLDRKAGPPARAEPLDSAGSSRGYRPR